MLFLMGYLLIDHLHISDFDSKIYLLHELFPFKVDKRIPFHAKSNENIIYIFP